MKLGELAAVRSGLVLSRKQARKGTPVKMRYPLLSFRAIHPNGYIDMEQLDGFDAAEQLSPEYLTQIGDVIIRLTSPYTAVLIDEASAGMVVSSNFVIIRVDRSRLLPGYLVWLVNTPKIRKAIYENTSSNMLGAINAMMSEGDVAIGAAGSLPGDMQRMWRPTGVDTYNMEYGYSTMGYEVAGALGVKLAIGDKHEVYSFCGDGSFNMLHGELITACQEHKKINICLFDNASFGCINNLQVGHGNVTLCTELRYRNKDGLFGNFMNIDYAKVAEAYGCKSYTVRTMEELVAAFEDAKKVKNVPVLFDIKVLPKTMTDGYSSWWRVGDTEVSERKENLAAYADLQAHLKEVRKY